MARESLMEIEILEYYRPWCEDAGYAIRGLAFNNFFVIVIFICHLRLIRGNRIVSGNRKAGILQTVM